MLKKMDASCNGGITFRMRSGRPNYDISEMIVDFRYRHSQRKFMTL